jgi:hypothetical protein
MNTAVGRLTAFDWKALAWAEGRKPGEFVAVGR